MKLYHQVLVSPQSREGAVLDRAMRLSDTGVAYADIFDDLANHGKFDEEGGELSQDDWDDARAR